MPRPILKCSLCSIVLILIFGLFARTNCQAQLKDQGQLSNVTTVPSTASTAQSAMLIPTSVSIEKFEKRVAKNKLDYRSASILARLYMRQAKEEDDFEGYVRAESILRDVLKSNPELVNEKVFLADALMAQHQFEAAEKLATQAFAESPRKKMILATVGDANLHLGNYQAAESAYERLAQSMQSPAVLVRLARIKEINGLVDEAIQLFAQAAEDQKSVAGLPSTERWYVWRLGKALLEAGQLDEAEKQFIEAIRLTPDDATTLADLAFIATSKKDYPTAVKLYLKAISCSEEPPILAALGDLYQRLGKKELADQVFSRAIELMDEESTHPKAGPAHARERARFFANHKMRLELALELAKKDLEVRKDVYGYDTLAWALYQTQDYSAASRAIEKAMSRGTRDANILFHAGMIKLACGEKSAGADYLNQAMLINPNFSIQNSPVAVAKLEKLELD